MFLPSKKQPHSSAIMVFSILMNLTVSPAEAADLSSDLINQYSSIDPFSFILLEFGLITLLALVISIYTTFPKNC